MGVVIVATIVGKLVAILNINSKESFFFILNVYLLCGTTIVAKARVGKLAITTRFVRKIVF